MTDVVAARSEGAFGVLRDWLRFDPSRVEAAEAAYVDFVGATRMGIWLTVAVVLTIVAFVVVSVSITLTHRGAASATITKLMLPLLTPIVTVSFYGVLALPLCFVKRATYASILRGCIGLPRGVAFGALLGVLCSVIAISINVLLMHTTAKRPPNVDPFVSGVGLGFFVAVVVAPVIEEFLMQAWLQTRFLRFGTVASVVLTTIAFVAMHLPTTIFSLALCVTLGVVAVIRATTRSLATCIAVHAGNNLVVTSLVLLARIGASALSHGSHIR